MISEVNKGLKVMLDNFLKNSNITGAFFIKGKWGIGKSYFIKKYIENLEKEENESLESNEKEKKNKRKYIYISLNGITSLDEINKSILAQLHPKYEKFKKNSVVQCVSGVFKIVAKSNPHISIDLDNKKIDSFFKIKGDLVLIFDDLERCQIDVIQVLGYINQFVEENGFKVIVIGNDEEIKNYKSIDVQNQENIIAAILSLNAFNNKEESEKKDNTISQYFNNEHSNPNKKVLNKIIKDISKVDYYSVVKEKVFALEYDYRFDIDVAYNQMKEYFEKYKINKSDFESLVRTLECQNLRSYLLSTFYIDEYKKKDTSFDDYSDDAKKNIIKNIIIEVVIFKNPRLLKTPIEYSTDILDHNFDSSLFNKFSKYHLLKYIHDYICMGIINLDNVSGVITKYEEILKNEKGINNYESLANLKSKNIFDYEDGELEERIKYLYDDMSANKIPLEYYFTCYNYFYYYDEVFQFKNEHINCKTFFDLLKKNLVTYNQKVNYDDHELYFIDTSLKNAYIEIQKVFDEHNKKHNKDEFNAGLVKSETRLNYKDYEPFAYDMKKFLGLFDIEIVFDFFRKSSNASLLDFCQIMNKFYDKSNVKDFFESDIDNIEMLIDFIDTQYGIVGNIRKHILYYTKKFLSDTLAKLKDKTE